MGLVLLSVLVVGAGSYLARSLFILVWADRQLPEGVMVSLRYVAPAVLSALVVTVLVDDNGQLDVGLPEVLGLTAGVMVGIKTRNHIWTLLVGMGAFWVTDLLLPLL